MNILFNELWMPYIILLTDWNGSEPGVSRLLQNTKPHEETSLRWKTYLFASQKEYFQSNIESQKTFGEKCLGLKLSRK